MSWVQGSPLGGREPAYLQSNCVGEKVGWGGGRGDLALLRLGL